METLSSYNGYHLTPENSLETPQNFDQFIAAANTTDIDVLYALNSTNPSAKSEFMSNPDLEVPPNTHDNLNVDTVYNNLSIIESLENSLSSSNLSSKERQVVEMALGANQAKNDFLMATILYNQDPTPENAAIYQSANETLYGKPDYDTFLSLLNDKLDTIYSRDLTTEDQQELKELKAMLGPVERPETPRYRPSDETVQTFSELAADYFAPIFAYIPEGQDTFTVKEATDITNQMLHDILPEGSSWSAEYEENRTAANVSQHSKTISFPGARADGDYTVDSLKKILVHEFGTHALRAIPYENSPIEMLRTGLPGYISFEEGIAKVMEQAVDGKYSDSGVDHYISIGLANFMHKNFRETYEIQKRLGHLSTGKDRSNALFNSVQRAFRGTDRLPNNKDLVYYNGANEVWHYIENNLDNPELFDNLFLSGKTNYTKPEHERISYEAKVGSFES